MNHSDAVPSLWKNPSGKRTTEQHAVHESEAQIVNNEKKTNYQWDAH